MILCASILSNKSLMEEATKCLFRTSLRSTHSTRMCFTASGHWQVPHSGKSSPESKKECVKRVWPIRNLFSNTVGAHLPFIGCWACRWINHYWLWRMASAMHKALCHKKNARTRREAANNTIILITTHMINCDIYRWRDNRLQIIVWQCDKPVQWWYWAQK